VLSRPAEQRRSASPSSSWGWSGQCNGFKVLASDPKRIEGFLAPACDWQDDVAEAIQYRSLDRQIWS
jgi:hypothetical protein